MPQPIELPATVKITNTLTMRAFISARGHVNGMRH
jgi:hypothetical protein